MWNDIRLLNALTIVMLVVAAFAAVASAAAWIVRRPWFDLHGIVVEPMPGQAIDHVKALQVRSVGLPQLKGNFFTLDLATARHAFEAVPWVRKATVAREWPDRLVVQVEEHVPIATWADGRGVNTHGELFAVNSAELDASGDLPDLAGPPGSEAMVAQRLRDFATWFAPLSLTPERVVLSGRYAWTVALSNNNGDKTVVELGRELDTNTLKERADRFVAYARQVHERWGGAIKEVDLRYPNGFAVRIAGVKFLPTKETK